MMAFGKDRNAASVAGSRRRGSHSSRHNLSNTGGITMKYILTCSDSIQAMALEKMTVTADNLDEAWEKAKRAEK